MHVDMYLNSPGPEVPDIHFSEMEEQDLRNVMAYLYVSLENGIQMGLDEAMLEVVRNWYDEVFAAVAEVSEDFRKRFKQGLIVPPGGAPVRARYMAIIKEASES